MKPFRIVPLYVIAAALIIYTLQAILQIPLADGDFFSAPPVTDHLMLKATMVTAVILLFYYFA